METSNRLQELKKQLSEEINKESSDNNIILILSNEIAKLDDRQVRFSVDAGIINRLGKELVARQETAVSELVKNAYDADATEVGLIFENAWNSGGKLTINDNGVGMNRKQLIVGFMRLSSGDKIHNPISDRYKRIRAGRKGIGRFATQRLGDKLTIITQALASNKALKVSIDWESFKTDKDLLEVTSPIEEIEKTKEEGTTLIIEGLREGWTDAMIKRVYRYTADLLQPFPLSKKRKEEVQERIDPGFKSSYIRRDNKVEIPIIDEQTAFYEHALAEIEGYVLDNGQACWTLTSEKLGIKEEVFFIGKDRDKPDSTFLHIRDVHFRAFYFIYDSSLLPSQTMTFIRDVANERGGIRVYRNGFRVLPYGEKLNDWLGLDESTAKRVILSSHRNINFFGFVEITDTSGVQFDETSSREGLFENEAFKEMVDFVQRSIISAVQKIAEMRGRKGSTSQRDWTKTEEGTNPSEEIDTAISDLDELLGSEESKTDDSDDGDNSRRFKQAFKRLKENREKEKQQFEEERKRLLEEINMLRILAGLGLVIGEYVHEIKRFLPAFDADTSFLKAALKDYAEGLKRVERLELNLKSFTSYTAYFDRAISQNVLRELKPIDLRDVVNDFETIIQSDIKRVKIKFETPVFEGFDLITVPMHPSEWASVLFNLYTNSKKAIKRKRNPGVIKIRCGRDKDRVFLEFSDNGDGISIENIPFIFNAFFTTSSAAGSSTNDMDSLTGTGLGLKIIRDIIESYGGEIFVAEATGSFNTTMRIEIPSEKKQ
ncbi:MAG: sensor histidine kinase [Ginsengibacter sp.]